MTWDNNLVECDSYITAKYLIYHTKCDMILTKQGKEGENVYKQCKTEQASKRQRQLEQGLLEAMHHHRFEEISVSDLCESMQVPRKTFYRYFEGKEGALYALIDHALQDYELYVTPRLDQDSSALTYIELVFHYWWVRKDLLDCLEKSGLEGVLVQRAILRANEEVSHPIRFLDQQMIGVHAHRNMFIVCGIMSMVLQWHHDGYSESVEQMALTALKLLTEPLVSL